MKYTWLAYTKRSAGALWMDFGDRIQLTNLKPVMRDPGAPVDPNFICSSWGVL